MFSKPFLAIFFISFMVWVGSIFVAGNPISRIDRSCAPINWSNTFVTSLTRLVAPSYAPKVDGFFRNRFQDCRYLVFQQFYESDYRKLQQENARAPEVAE